MTRRIVALASLALALSAGVASAAQTPLQQAKDATHAVLTVTIAHYSLDITLKGGAQSARCDPFVPKIPETIYCDFQTTRPVAVCVVKLHVITVKAFNGAVLCGKATGPKDGQWGVTTDYHGTAKGIVWSHLQGSTP